MGKQWGHGFFKGKEEATKLWAERDIQFAKEYSKAIRDWIFENIDENMKHSGRLMLGLCPFHKEKTPSCTYDPLTDKYHCFGCGKTGDGEELARGYCCDIEDDFF